MTRSRASETAMSAEPPFPSLMQSRRAALEAAVRPLRGLADALQAAQAVAPPAAEELLRNALACSAAVRDLLLRTARETALELPAWADAAGLEAAVAAAAAHLAAREEAPRRRLRELAAELGQGQAAHRRPSRQRELERLRTEAAAELAGAAGQGRPPVLPGGEGPWLEWWFRLDGPAQEQALAALHPLLPALGRLLDVLEAEHWHRPAPPPAVRPVPALHHRKRPPTLPSRGPRRPEAAGLRPEAPGGGPPPANGRDPAAPPAAPAPVAHAPPPVAHAPGSPAPVAHAAGSPAPPRVPPSPNGAAPPVVPSRRLTVPSEKPGSLEGPAPGRNGAPRVEPPPPEPTLDAEPDLPADWLSFDGFSRDHWIDPTGECQPAPWADPKAFLPRLHDHFARALQPPAFRWAYLCAAAAGRIDPAALPAPADVAALAAVWAHPLDFSAGRDEQRGGFLTAGAGVDAGPRSRLALFLEALRPWRERFWAHDEIDLVLEEVRYQSGCLAAVVKGLLQVASQGVDPAPRLADAFREKTIEGPAVLQRQLQAKRGELQQVFSRLWMAAGGAVQRTHCRAVWDAFITLVQPVVEGLFPEDRHGKADWDVEAVRRQIDRFLPEYQRLADAQGVKFQDRRVCDRGARQIMQAAAEVNDLMEQVHRAAGRRSAHDALPLPLDAVRSLRKNGPLDDPLEECCRQLLLRCVTGPPPAQGADGEEVDPLELTLADLADYPELVALIDPSALTAEAAPAVRKSQASCHVTDVLDPVRAAAVLLAGPRPRAPAEEPPAQVLLRRLAQHPDIELLARAEPLLGLPREEQGRLLARRGERHEEMRGLHAQFDRACGALEALAVNTQPLRAVAADMGRLLAAAEPERLALAGAWFRGLRDHAERRLLWEVQCCRRRALAETQGPQREAVLAALAAGRHGAVLPLLLGAGEVQLGRLRETCWRHEVESRFGRPDRAARQIKLLDDPIAHAWQPVTGQPAQADRPLRTAFARLVFSGDSPDGPSLFCQGTDDPDAFAVPTERLLAGGGDAAAWGGLTRFARLVLLTPPVAVGRPEFRKRLVQQVAGYPGDLCVVLTPQIPAMTRREALEALAGRHASLIDDYDLCRLLNPGGPRPRVLPALLEVVFEQLRWADVSPFRPDAAPPAGVLPPADAAAYLAGPLARLGIDAAAEAPAAAHRCGCRYAVLACFGACLLEVLERAFGKANRDRQGLVVTADHVAHAFGDPRVERALWSALRECFEGNERGFVVYTALLQEFAGCAPGAALDDAPRRVLARLRGEGGDLSWLAAGDEDPAAVVRAELGGLVEQQLLVRRPGEADRVALPFPHHLPVLLRQDLAAEAGRCLRQARQDGPGPGRSLLAAAQVRDLQVLLSDREIPVRAAVVGSLWPDAVAHPAAGLPARLGIPPGAVVSAADPGLPERLCQTPLVLTGASPGHAGAVLEARAGPTNGSAVPLLLGGIDLLRWALAQARTANADVEVLGLGRLSPGRLRWWFNQVRGLALGPACLACVRERTSGVPLLVGVFDRLLAGPVTVDQFAEVLRLFDQELLRAAAGLLSGPPGVRLLPREVELLHMAAAASEQDDPPGRTLGERLTTDWEFYRPLCPVKAFDPASDAVLLEGLQQVGLLPVRAGPDPAAPPGAPNGPLEQLAAVGPGDALRRLLGGLPRVQQVARDVGLAS
jgi:hypothetical protein